MALYKTVTEYFPTDLFAGALVVGLHLKLEDDERPDLGEGKQIVIDSDFTENYTLGEGSMKQATKDSIQAKAQAAIDSYKARRQMWATAAYGNAISEIGGNLNID